jgi:hypothetical protein
MRGSATLKRSSVFVKDLNRGAKSPEQIKPHFNTIMEQIHGG